MVLCLRAAVYDNHASAGIDSCFCEDLQKQRLWDVVGAGARDKEAARLQQLQGTKVNLLIAALGGRDAVAILCESRWVENHHLELASHLVVLLQDVEGIAFAKSDVGDGIDLLIAARGCNCRGGHVSSLHMLAVAGHRQSEAPVVAEAVEHFAGGIAAS